MHRSQLGGFIIDCQTNDLDSAASFWSQALGYPVKGSSDPADNQYVTFKTPANELQVEVQSVDHASRVHIDIEADDIEAEVTRLEKLGAKRLKKIHSWWVMEAPTGHRFCVIQPQRDNFATQANRWE